VGEQLPLFGRRRFGWRRFGRWLVGVDRLLVAGDDEQPGFAADSRGGRVEFLGYAVAVVRPDRPGDRPVGVGRLK